MAISDAARAVKAAHTIIEALECINVGVRQALCCMLKLCMTVQVQAVGKGMAYAGAGHWLAKYCFEAAVTKMILSFVFLYMLHGRIKNSSTALQKKHILWFLPLSSTLCVESASFRPACYFLTHTESHLKPYAARSTTT